MLVVETGISKHYTTAPKRITRTLLTGVNVIREIATTERSPGDA